jgi:hypothetical protein
MVQMGGRALATTLLVLAATSCGRDPLPLLRPATSMPQDAGGTPDPNQPLGLSAELNVDLRVDNGAENAKVSALFWTGAERPKPGGGGGPSLRLDHEAGESITVNDIPLEGTVADWGYLYLALSVPEPADGRWLFRLTRGGRTVEAAMSVQRSRFEDFPPGPVSINRGVTLRWTPPFPDESRRQAYLTSCALTDAKQEIGAASATFWGRLSVTPCNSHAHVIASFEEPLGPPFAGGSSMAASVWLDRPIVLF